MRSLSSGSRGNRIILFLIGALLGAVCFIGVYGVRVLDPSYDDWLLLGDMDLRQHYIGFCHFRQSRWQFPIGLIETLSYPMSMSVIYTDSIPLLAVLFKLLAWFLPVKFQYFGWAGLLSFMLMGGFSCLLLSRFVKNRALCALCSLFFILSYPVIQRMFYHTALAAQWIIILALVLWFFEEELTVVKRTVLWCIMGLLCVGIHSYFLPMAGLILLCAVAEEVMAGKEKALFNGMMELAGFCLTALTALFVLGGFYGGTSAVGEGLGTFSANLNTFINPLKDGKLYPGLPLYYDFQYEGFAYLGGGCLLLLVLSGLILIVFSAAGYLKPAEYIKKHSKAVLSLCLFLVTLALAVFPIVSFDKVKLFGVPYPGFIRKLLGIFRSNGRFIWVCFYLLLLAGCAGSVRLIQYCVKGRKGVIISFVSVSAALLLQLCDISGMLKGKYDYFAAEQHYQTLWERIEPVKDIESYSGFVFMYNDNDILMDTAYYGYLHGMWQNNYYYARDINDAVEMNIAQWNAALSAGKIRKDIIYIYRELEGDIKPAPELEQVYFDGHIAGYKKK